MTQNDTPNDGTERLIEYFRDEPTVEVDHAITLYLAPGKRVPWRGTEMIRENGYKIQDVENGEGQTKITLVRDTSDYARNQR